ncbi:DUF6455 family protein [Elongatibacter sediminis]|uniref:DUF6455 family protein n=1 Tax=Elongatibacter sediminis TaxID=3119006 RepID=A0AAW9RHC5_9GAMM
MNGYVIAITLVFTAAAFTGLFLLYKSDMSQRRMRRMLRRNGLNPRILDEHDFETIAKRVRHRCEKCQSEDVCERWLAGELPGANDFCPNAQLFRDLKQVGDSPARAGTGSDTRH